MRKSKGLQLQDLSDMAISLVVLVVVLAVGSKILGTVYSNEPAGVCFNTNSSCNLVQNLTSLGGASLALFGSWFNILVIVIIAVVVIGLLMGYFQRAT